MKETAANRAQAQRNADVAKINAQYPNAQQTNSEIRYIIQKQGTGNKPTPGKTVSLNYTGRLLSGVVFDSSDVRGKPLEFQVGTGVVIRGMDETALDMKVGEKRLVIIPPELAYGDRIMGNGIIPANSFLIFEMELVDIR
ncbi:MAG: FKBP-type peptidyl-prolyl cis-trans isomerase [Treponema sp.]|nr:FKBP-type peptidyl-prolyl cis-trans isomerase [Treponema sp.]